MVDVLLPHGQIIANLTIRTTIKLTDRTPNTVRCGHTKNLYSHNINKGVPLKEAWCINPKAKMSELGTDLVSTSPRPLYPMAQG